MKRLFFIIALYSQNNQMDKLPLGKHEALEEIKQLLKQIRYNMDGIYEELKQNH